MRKRVLSEASSTKDVDLAVVKCLTGAKLTREEVEKLCAVSEADLIKKYGCDRLMVEKVKSHSKSELFRLRSQNLYTRDPSYKTLYPENPYNRTYPIKESRKRKLSESFHGNDHENLDHSHSSEGGRMLDYGHQKSDSEEGRMMKQILRDIAVDAYRLHQMLEDGDDLPQWCQYKTAQAQQMVGSVRNYLEYKFERMGDDLVGEEEMFDPEEMKEDFGEGSAKVAMDSWSEEDSHEVEDYDKMGINLEDSHDASTWAAGYKAAGGKIPSDDEDHESEDVYDVYDGYDDCEKPL